MDDSEHLPDELRQLLEDGIALVNEGAAERAKANFEMVLSRAPNCAKALCARGIALYWLGNFEEAITDYDAALELDPNYARALFNRGLAKFELSHVDSALADMDQAIGINPETRFYYHRSRCFVRLEKYDEAASDMTACIELYPDVAAGYYWRGSIYSQQGKTDDAIRDYEEALRRGYANPQIYVWLGYELIRRKEYPRAVAVLDQGIEAHGDDPELLFRRGCALFYEDDFESAVRDFDQALVRNTDAAEVVYWRGCAQEWLGDYEAAIADFSLAIEWNRSYFDAFVARGRVQLHVHDSESAIVDLSRAIDLNANDVQPFAERGRAWWIEGDDQRALEDFDHALRVDPNHKKALRARSQLYLELGNLEHAEADLDSLEHVMMKSSNGDNMAQRRTRISLLLAEHFRPLSVDDLAITERKFPFRVRADLQRAVSRLFDESTRIEQFCGVKKEHSYEGIFFSDLLYPSSHSPALAVPPEYEEVDIGEKEPARCLKNGLWFLATGKLKYAVLLSPTKEHGRTTGMQFQVAVPQEAAGTQIAQQFFTHLETAVAKSESYRGKILSLELDEFYSGMSTGIRVHKLRTVEREQVILPAATLELLDRNIVQFARQRDKLQNLGLSTKEWLKNNLVV